MSLPPGLLPEQDEVRPARAPLLLGVVVCIALLAVLVLLLQNRKLAAERDEALNRIALKSPTPAASSPPPAFPEPIRIPTDPVSAPAAAVEDPAAAPVASRVPKVRVLPEDPEVLSRGLQEFRAARYDQAERQFFRAIPDSFVYLALTGLAQRNWKEAFSFLSRAMAADSRWLQRVNPRDLFGKDADYAAVLQALDEQLAKNPLDADLKTLAAYVRYHDKGAPYAKALLIEATTVSPDHEAAKAFLEALGP